MQFLSNFRQSSWIRMLKTHNMAEIGCPLGFSGKIVAVYQVKKVSNDTKNDKNSIFCFSQFLRNFCQILTNFVDWNFEKRQQGKNFSPVGFFEEFIAVF